MRTKELSTSSLTPNGSGPPRRSSSHRRYASCRSLSQRWTETMTLTSASSMEREVVAECLGQRLLVLEIDAGLQTGSAADRQHHSLGQRGVLGAFDEETSQCVVDDVTERTVPTSRHRLGFGEEVLVNVHSCPH